MTWTLRPCADDSTTAAAPIPAPPPATTTQDPSSSQIDRVVPPRSSHLSSHDVIHPTGTHVKACSRLWPGSQAGPLPVTCRSPTGQPQPAAYPSPTGAAQPAGRLPGQPQAVLGQDVAVDLGRCRRRWWSAGRRPGSCPSVRRGLRVPADRQASSARACWIPATTSTWRSARRSRGRGLAPRPRWPGVPAWWSIPWWRSGHRSP